MEFYQVAFREMTDNAVGKRTAGLCLKEELSMVSEKGQSDNGRNSSSFWSELLNVRERNLICLSI